MANPLLVVLTAPRPNGASYLERTLAALDASGATEFPGERLVFSDGPLDRAAWPIVSTGTRQGNRAATWNVLRLARERRADYLVFCEDDISPCRNAIPRIVSIDVPEDVAFITFFDGRIVPDGAAPGLYREPSMGRDGKGFWGSQCLKIPLRAVEHLAALDPTALLDHGKWRRWIPEGHSGDIALGLGLVDSPWPTYAIHVPNLVQHIGEVSATQWPDHVEKMAYYRRSRNFPGEEFDALSLDG